MTICDTCANAPLCRQRSYSMAKCSDYDPIFDVYKKAVDTYGIESQLTVFYGELGELMTAVADLRRGRDTKDHVAEEMAYVLICCKQIMCALGIEQRSVLQWQDKKLQRLAVRLANGETDCHVTGAPRNDSMEKKAPSVEPDLLAEYPQIVQCLYRCASYDCDETCRYHGRDECNDGLMQDAALLLDKFGAALTGKEPGT